MKVKVQGHFTKSEIISESSFLLNSCIITVLFLLVGSFVQYCKKFFLMDFPLFFSKMDLVDVGGCFHIQALKPGRNVHITALKSPRET